MHIYVYILLLLNILLKVKNSARSHLKNNTLEYFQTLGKIKGKRDFYKIFLQKKEVSIIAAFLQKVENLSNFFQEYFETFWKNS